MVISWLVDVNGVGMRIALITYSRKIVSQTMNRIKRYGRAIEDIANFYSRMKEKGRVGIDVTLFEQNYCSEGLAQLEAARIPPHLDTCLHWSAMGGDALLRINREYSPTYQQGLALLLSLTACNSPDYFRIISDALLSDNELGQKYFKKPAINIAIEVYEMIFQFKAEASRNKQILPGQRHQPFANKQASREVIGKSLSNLISVSREIARLDKKSWNEKKTIAEVYRTTIRKVGNNVNKGGVFGAGPLISNKIIQVGALVGLFPFQFLHHSVIAENTCTHKFLKNIYGLGEQRDSTILLNGIATVTQSNQRIAEGSCCKAAQEWSHHSTGKPTMFVDTIYKGMSILTTEISDTTTRVKVNQLRIVEITADGKKNVKPSELVWRKEKNWRETAWTKCGGYWMGTPEKTVAYKEWQKKGLRAKGVDSSLCKTEKLQSPKALGQDSNVRFEEVPTLTQKRKRCATDKKKTSGSSGRQKGNSGKTHLNYPSQSDVLMSNNRCHAFLDLWKLLGMALNKKGGNRAAKKDIALVTMPIKRKGGPTLMEVVRLSDGGQYTPITPPNGTNLYIPSITDQHAMVYHPPVPTSSWKVSKFQVTTDGRVCFTDPDVARKYTLVHYLKERHGLLLLDYLTPLLVQKTYAYVPQRLVLRSTRVCDPVRMVVLFDNDSRKVIVPMALALLFRGGRSSFVLVDDFGEVMKDTAYQFMISPPSPDDV